MKKKSSKHSSNKIRDGVLASLLKIINYSLLVYIIYSFLIILFFKWVNPPTTAFILSSYNGNYFNFFYPKEIDQIWIPYNQISDYIKVAVIASEDQRFKEHFGFDFTEIKNALNEMENGYRVRGASTITQQVAKNLFLTKDKIFIRKIIEAYYTVLIELLWSKERILEVYLNIAELGNNMFGVEAAANTYFNKAARYLNKSESALLAAIIPSPKKYNITQPTEYLLKRRRDIYEQMNLIGGENYLIDL